MHKIISLEQTCYACPSQWDAVTSDDRRVYIRFRWGLLTVEIGEPGDTAFPDHEILEKVHSDGMDGFMTEATMKELTASVLDWTPEAKHGKEA